MKFLLSNDFFNIDDFEDFMEDDDEGNALSELKSSIYQSLMLKRPQLSDKEDKSEEL